MIRVERLSFRFGGRWVLRDIALGVDAGGFVFLTGPSGAGKTTLLRILHGALPVMRGRVVVAGHDLAAMRPSRLHLLRRDVSVVFQDFKILADRSVYDNVALPLVVRGMERVRMDRRVRAVLHALRLEELTRTPCAELSGGEQQRVAIARAVVTGPRLVLADEPTGNLDAELGARLLDIFRQFNAHGATIVLATHNRGLFSAVPEAGVIDLGGGERDPGGYDVSGAPRPGGGDGS